MNLEDIIKKVAEALQLAEDAKECMQRSEHPSISDCGECFVYAGGATDLLEELERDLRSELLAGVTNFVTIADMAGNKDRGVRMINHGDLSRPAQVRVVDRHARTWRTLWLTKRPVFRVVWAGYINHVTYRLNGGATLEMEDAMTRLARRGMAA